MKTSLILTLLAVTAFNAPVQAATPIETLVPIKHVYVPKGFDSNDQTEVMVSGYLPNLCYRGHKSKVSVKDHTIQIQITSF